MKLRQTYSMANQIPASHPRIVVYMALGSSPRSAPFRERWSAQALQGMRLKRPNQHFKYSACNSHHSLLLTVPSWKQIRPMRTVSGHWVGSVARVTLEILVQIIPDDGAIVGPDIIPWYVRLSMYTCLNQRDAQSILRDGLYLLSESRRICPSNYRISANR